MAPPVIETKAEIEARLQMYLPRSPFDYTGSVCSETNKLVEDGELLERLKLKVSHDNLDVPGIRFPLLEELIKDTILQDARVHSITRVQGDKTTVCAQMLQYKSYGASDQTLERLTAANALYNELKRWESVLSHETFGLGRCVVLTRDDLELKGTTRPKGAYCQVAWFFEFVPHNEVFNYKKAGRKPEGQDQKPQDQGQDQGGNVTF